MTRPRVVYWNSIPSPYVVERFNAVARRGTIDFEAWFCARTETDRSWRVDEEDFEFRHAFLPGPHFRLSRFGHRHWNVPAPLLRGRAPGLLVSLYADPTFIVGWWLARQMGARTAFRYLPTYDAWIDRTAQKEAIKRHLFHRADGFKTSGPAGLARLVAYGVPAERIHVVTQSIDVDRHRHGAAAWRPRREEVRADLGVSGVVFLYVGRLWTGKGLDHLLHAYRRVTEPGDIRISLLIVGDGRDEVHLRHVVERLRLPRVVFSGFIQQDDLARFHAAADVFVFPTLGDPNGLVVEEAMAAGLPVIATDAAGDIRSRVPDGVAGLIVPSADAEALAVAMRGLAMDPLARQALAEAAALSVRGRDHERYAADFELFVERTMAMPRVGRRVRRPT